MTPEQRRQEWRTRILGMCMSLRGGERVVIPWAIVQEHFGSLDDLRSAAMGTGSGHIQFKQDIETKNVIMTADGPHHTAEDHNFRYHVDEDRQWLFTRAFLDAPGWVPRDFAGEEHEKEHGYRTYVHPLLEHHYDRTEQGWKPKPHV